MATGNFMNKNASRIFAVELNNEWDHKDETDYAKSRIKDNTPKECEYFEDSGWDGERNFGGHYLGYYTASRTYNCMEINITIKAIARSGYYSGMNYDYEIECEVGGKIYNCVPGVCDITGDFTWNADNGGLAKVHARYASDWIDNMERKMTDAMEKAFSESSTPLIVAARFSNGEEWYEKAA